MNEEYKIKLIEQIKAKQMKVKERESIRDELATQLEGQLQEK